MKANVGGIDRILRITLGSALIVWAAALGGPAWAWIGIVPLLTGVTKFCPIYPIFGIRTCSSDKS